MDNNIRFINENEVALMMGLSIQTLRNWRTLGKELAYSKAGRAVRYRLDEVLAYMDKRKIQPRQ